MYGRKPQHIRPMEWRSRSPEEYYSKSVRYHESRSPRHGRSKSPGCRRDYQHKHRIKNAKDASKWNSSLNYGDRGESKYLIHTKHMIQVYYGSWYCKSLGSIQ